MSIDNVQLKQEEVVGNEVVLQDIYPKTTTESVIDSSTGASMDVTIDRIWNSVNKKLSRIVNSVNGRTGVVVLDADDVGLGNVDNVSFADIKEWVINKLKIEFGNKRLKLFNDLTELHALIDSNDEMYRDTAFFSEHGLAGDMKSYIGYIWMDEGKNELTYDCMPINTIGYTDNSIIYDEKLDNSKDLVGGGIGVNIWKYEDALKLYEGLTKAESGLRIDKTKIVSDLYHFDGVYGDGTTGDTTALLYIDDSIPTGVSPKSVTIFIDDKQVIYNLKIRQSFKKGDLIVCCFKNYKCENDDGDITVPTGMCPSLMFRNPCIGQVTHAPTVDIPNDDYTIKFYSIKPNIGWGLKYIENHKDGTTDKEMTIELSRGVLKHLDYDETGEFNVLPYYGNMSGLQVMASPNSPSPTDFSKDADVNMPEGVSTTVLPFGFANVYFNNNTHGGLHISPDISMCVMPYEMFGRHTAHPESTHDGSRFVSNWTIPFEADLSDITEENCIDKGMNSAPSFVGVNLNKGVMNLSEHAREYEEYKFLNMSGLKLTGYYGSGIVEDFDYSSIGMIDEDDYTGKIKLDNLQMSGGISVNVGKFLEIDPGEDYPETMDDFYSTGKVNVRVGKGLYDSGDNRISISLASGSGLWINQKDKLQVSLKNPGGISHYGENGSLYVALAQNGGLKYTTTNDTYKTYAHFGTLAVDSQPLFLVDRSANTIYYHPILNNDNDHTNMFTINIGAGLQITD